MNCGRLDKIDLHIASADTVVPERCHASLTPIRITSADENAITAFAKLTSEALNTLAFVKSARSFKDCRKRTIDL